MRVHIILQLWMNLKMRYMMIKRSYINNVRIIKYCMNKRNIKNKNSPNIIWQVLYYHIQKEL